MKLINLEKAIDHAKEKDYIKMSGQEEAVREVFALATVEAVPIDILDKIRAEIEKQEKWLLQAGYTAYNADIAFSSIKSVLAESEGGTQHDD